MAKSVGPAGSKKAAVKPLSEGNKPRPSMKENPTAPRMQHPAINALTQTPFGVSGKAMQMIKGKKSC